MQDGGEVKSLLYFYLKQSTKAYEVAENIRTTIMNKEFKEVNHITISLGVTQLKKRTSKKSFLKRVDLALYKAKDSGRNTSVSL